MNYSSSLVFLTMINKKVIYIDTDPGLGTPGAEIDDAVALMLLTNHQGIEIVGIGSVFGNVPVEDAFLNLSRWMDFLNAGDIPIGEGSAKPLSGNLDWFKEWQLGYESTLSYKPRYPAESSIDIMLACAKKYSGQLIILSLGPMTNIAEAIRLDPGVMTGVKKIIAMGGSFANQVEPPEFNIHCDPRAANQVIHSGISVILFGLNVTRKAVFSKLDFEHLKGENEAITLLKNQAPGWIDRVISMGWESDGCSLHDAVAAAYLIDENIFNSLACDVSVATDNYSEWGSINIRKDLSETSKIRVIDKMDVEKCREIIWNGIRKWEQ